jgi:hypothetical protein
MPDCLEHDAYLFGVQRKLFIPKLEEEAGG